jgi:hypothetical protein
VFALACFGVTNTSGTTPSGIHGNCLFHTYRWCFSTEFCLHGCAVPAARRLIGQTEWAERAKVSIVNTQEVRKQSGYRCAVTRDIVREFRVELSRVCDAGLQDGSASGPGFHSRRKHRRSSCAPLDGGLIAGDNRSSQRSILNTGNGVVGERPGLAVAIGCVGSLRGVDRLSVAGQDPPAVLGGVVANGGVPAAVSAWRSGALDALGFARQCDRQGRLSIP